MAEGGLESPAIQSVGDAAAGPLLDQFDFDHCDCGCRKRLFVQGACEGWREDRVILSWEFLTFEEYESEDEQKVGL